MAKKKQKKADKAEKPAKAAKAKLPKRIAGVKVPKPLRESGEKLVEVMNHPIFADVVAASLVAAANALREDKDVRTAAGAALGKAAQTVSGQSGALGAMLTGAAIDGIARAAKRGRKSDSDGTKAG